MNVFRSELFKLRTTRATKVVWLSAVILPSIIFVLTAIFGFNNDFVDRTLIWYLGSASSALVGLLMGVVGVLCSTQEYSQGTIRITLVATPSRSHVIVAKFLTVLWMTILGTAALITLSLVPAIAIMNARDLSFSVLGSDIRILFSMFLLTIGLGQLGLFLGIIFKSSPGALSALLLWPTIIEALIFGLLSLIFDDARLRFAPIQGNGFSLVADRYPEDNSWAMSLGYFYGFIAIFVMLGVIVFRRRDA